MSLTQRWEVSYPVSWILELLYLLLWNVHHSEQIVLEINWFTILWEFRWVTVSLELIIKFDSCGTYWHTCAMETEREQNVIAVKSFIPCVEITFSHWECMTQMQKTIHIGIWECLKEFGFLIGLYWEILISIPDISSSLF